jgi:hypothetical protein
MEWMVMRYAALKRRSDVLSYGTQRGAEMVVTDWTAAPALA